MKTLEEFYKELANSKALQDEMKAASDEMLEAFLKKHGCSASAKEFTAFLRALSEGEIDDSDAADAAGGFPPQAYLEETPTGYFMPI